jgi:hypothetical protein
LDLFLKFSKTGTRLLLRSKAFAAALRAYLNLLFREEMGPFKGEISRALIRPPSAPKEFVMDQSPQMGIRSILNVMTASVGDSYHLQIKSSTPPEHRRVAAGGIADDHPLLI